MYILFEAVSYSKILTVLCPEEEIIKYKNRMYLTGEFAARALCMNKKPSVLLFEHHLKVRSPD